MKTGSALIVSGRGRETSKHHFNFLKLMSSESYGLPKMAFVKAKR